MLLVALFAAAIGAAPAPKSQSYEDVQVGAVTLHVPFPAGYCIPRGEDTARFQQLAAPDNRNITLLSLMDCRGDLPSNKYLIVKAPVRGLDMAVDRAEAIKELSQAVEQPDFAAETKSMPNEVGAAKSAATGVQTDVVAKYGPRGHDDVCVYFGGSMTTTRRGNAQNQAVGSCMTVVGHRFVELHAYEDSNDPQAYKTLLPKLRLWALGIQPRS